ncbi:MSCRAMM family protein [Peptostreptococcus faecalis]|uniref:MSCRAMM family protein n=1 Tax=Peptostreptococcus faecalis TaxID=2045015 RepID=UPI000C7A5C86|nr:prealbumin-like fold domain-containing protein [Peptostreptococcus faecalis]
MKNKKYLNLLAALAIAIPMTISVGAINGVFADSNLNFTKIDSSSGNGLGGASIDFYKGSSKIFSAKTKEDGKLDPASLSRSGFLDSEGNIKLQDGQYSYYETKAPGGYMINVQGKSFSVSGGVGDSTELSNTKFTGGRGQLIIRVTGKNLNTPLSGSTIDLYKTNSKGAYVKVAILDSGEDGYLVDGYAPTADIGDTQIEVVNGTLSLTPGSYMVQEENAPTGYAKNTKRYTVKVYENHIADRVNITHKTSDTNVSGETGFKLTVVDSKTQKGLENQEIAVYSTDANGKNEKLVFLGKTGSDGLLDPSKTLSGGGLSSNGVLTLEPGNYYYKLNNYADAKNRTFTVAEGKVTPSKLSLTSTSAGTTTTNGNSTKTSTNSTSNGNNTKTGTSSLAKTGQKNLAIYSVIGAAMVIGGVIVYKRR